ncbi:MAG: hypothetical protein A2113_02730 [Candidatus Woykebacteria bacterium GWA1_44_8]|uniref:Beta-lactamase class A catalytic domain-containing protein n=1 Tax=Candidatus Woykebacteria bacterium GWA1_44_8 TaxID=1802591 RepID=A0A1G1W335_9BACT|nr:MAG: hypothetical protein A2113_02730 [Candidatus Woykebacteria bacterium GWA1_44_8]
MKKSTLAIAFAVGIAGFLIASCVLAAAPSGELTGDTVTPVGETNASVTIASDYLPDPEQAVETVTGPAERLDSYRQECSRRQSGEISTTFGWLPSGGGLQWLDISLFPNDFAPGTYIGIGPFLPEAASFIWGGLMPGRVHYLRVNTLTAYGWKPSETLVFGTGRCQGGVVVETPTPDFMALQQSLAEAVESSGLTDAAVAVTDLQTGETVSVNGDRPHLGGCVMNFFVLLQATLDVQNGLYPESVVGSLISATIWSSNPGTAFTLYNIVGGGNALAGVEKVQALITDRLGLDNIILDHPPATEVSRGVDANNWLTAEDVNKALTKLYWGEVLNPFWRDYLLQKMEGVKPGLQYLLGSTPGGIVSHKNGFFWSDGWVDNDIGIVRFERGGITYAYAISFFSQHVPSKYDDIPLGQDIMAVAWRYFSEKYQ